MLHMNNLTDQVEERASAEMGDVFLRITKQALADFGIASPDDAINDLMSRLSLRVVGDVEVYLVNGQPLIGFGPLQLDATYSADQVKVKWTRSVQRDRAELRRLLGMPPDG